MTDPNTPKMLIVREIAVLLRTTPEAVYSKIQRHKFPGVVRTEGRVLVRMDAFLDWLCQESARSLLER